MHELINRCSVAVHQKTTSEKQSPAKIITFLMTKSSKHQVHRDAGAVLGLVTSVAVTRTGPFPLETTGLALFPADESEMGHENHRLFAQNTCEVIIWYHL